MRIILQQLSSSWFNSYTKGVVASQICSVRGFRIPSALGNLQGNNQFSKMSGREELDKISSKLVEKVPEGGGALELSQIQPLLEANNVRLIGIGLEPLGVHEFIAGNFFKGELYLDKNKEQYKALGFKRFNWCNMWLDLISNLTRTVARRGKANNIENNFKGDGFQSGGTLIVEKGGTGVILSYKMQAYADHLDNATILKALGIKADPSVIEVEPRRSSENSGSKTD